MKVTHENTLLTGCPVKRVPIRYKGKFELYLFGHSKLSCGCGWTLNYRVGDFHPLFYACGWTLNYRVGAENPSIGYD